MSQQWNQLADRGLGFAMRLSPDVWAVHVTALGGEEDASEHQIRGRWAEDVERPAIDAGLKPPRLVLIKSQYRLMYAPLLLLVKEMEKQFPSRTIAVLLPEIVKTNWWQYLLHTHRARRVRTKLLRLGGSRLVVISLPLYIERPAADEMVSAEAAERSAIPLVAETRLKGHLEFRDGGSAEDSRLSGVLRRPGGSVPRPK